MSPGDLEILFFHFMLMFTFTKLLKHISLFSISFEFKMILTFMDPNMN